LRKFGWPQRRVNTPMSAAITNEMTIAHTTTAAAPLPGLFFSRLAMQARGGLAGLAAVARQTDQIPRDRNKGNASPVGCLARPVGRRPSNRRPSRRRCWGLTLGEVRKSLEKFERSGAFRGTIWRFGCSPDMSTREVFYTDRAHDYLVAAQCARGPGERAALLSVAKSYAMLAQRWTTRLCSDFPGRGLGANSG
jgi:hypothetical protein